MRINLISVGKKLPGWINTGYLEYARRLNQECTLNLIELNPPRRAQNLNSEIIKEKEAKLIRATIPKGNFIITLDENGTEYNTEQLAEKLQTWLTSGQDIALIIGGADGLDQSLINDSHESWSLSQLTLPHALVRVIVAEQIYRAWSLLRNHPYHRV